MKGFAVSEGEEDLLAVMFDGSSEVFTEWSFNLFYDLMAALVF